MTPPPLNGHLLLLILLRPLLLLLLLSVTWIFRRRRRVSSLSDALIQLSELPMMAIEDQKSTSDGKVWGFLKLTFRHSATSATTSSRTSHHTHPPVEGTNPHASASVSSVARSLLPTRRRLKLDPSNKLFFPCELFSCEFFFDCFWLDLFCVLFVYCVWSRSIVDF